jgi:hypothetical protein
LVSLNGDEMTDTERLNLIEHYQWDVMHHNGEWLVLGKFGITPTFIKLREAVDVALNAQAKWALGK